MVTELLYAGAVLVASAIGALAAAWLWNGDDEIPIKLFVVVVSLHALVGVLVLAQLFAPTDSLTRWLYGIQTAVASFVPAFWFLFAFAFTRFKRTLSRPLAGFVLGTIGVLALLEATNPLHGLVWSDYQVVGATIPHLEGTPTGLFFLLSLPLSLFYYGGLGLLGAHALFETGVRRKQTSFLFLGYFPPVVVLNAWFFGLIPGPLNGALVIGSTWSLALAGWAIRRYKLFDLVPLARETVFEGLDDPVIVVDDDLRLLDYNSAAIETLPELAGGDGTELGNVLPGIISEEDTDGDSPFATTFTYYGAESPREFTVNPSPLEPDGEIRGYGLVLRDVTEREQHLRDLEQQTAQLERFASTLSHDIRNPLNVAQGRVELELDEGGSDNLDAASDALDRIEQIISDLLTLAREGQTIDEQARVGLADLARDAWEMTDTAAATLEMEGEADMTIYADRNRLRNVFENLFRNAVEHGSTSPDSQARQDAVEHGGSDVTVTVGCTIDGFYVEDDGPGIPSDEWERVFDYEYTTTETGTGLGLAIVEAIARAHGWSVGVEHADGGGARFLFTGVDVVECPGGVEATTAVN